MNDKDFSYAILDMKKMINKICAEKRLWNNHDLCAEAFEEFYKMVYNEIHNVLAMFPSEENEKDIREIISRFVIGFQAADGKKHEGMLAVLENKLNDMTHFTTVDQMSLKYKFSQLYENFYALAAFRSLKHFATIMEWDLEENKRIHTMTMNCFGGYWYHATQAILNYTWKKIFTQAPTGMGKCKLATTKVRTPDGMRTLGDLQIGDKVYSMKDNSLVESVVTNRWDTRKPQCKITTRGGVQVITSPEHRLYTQRGYVEAQDLTVNDYLYRLCAEIDGGEPIDEFELMFVSLMLFDGHCKYPCFRFTHQDNELFKMFTDALNEHGMTYIYLKGLSNCKEISIHSNDGKTKQILEKYGLLNKLSKDKVLPKQFFNMPLEQKYKFLGYMFATDGSFDKRTSTAEITLASEQLIDDIQMLCNSCGIYTSKCYKRTRLGDKYFDSWGLYVPAYYLERIYKHCYCYDKQATLEEIMKNINNFEGGAYCNNTNYPKEVLADCKEFRQKTNKQWARNKTFKQSYVEQFNEETHLLDDVVSKDFVWEQIKSIEYDSTEVDMVDIEVKDTHNFIANDLVSHNSYKDTTTIAFIFGYDPNSDILKVTGNPSTLAMNSQRLIKYMLKPMYAKVFPYYAQFECDKDKMFDVAQMGGLDKPTRLLIHGSEKGESLLMCNKMTPIDGSRFKYKFYDDITKSKDKAKLHIHQQDVEMYDSEWERRKYDDFHNLEFFSGTAYHNEDFICTLKRRMGADAAIRSPVNKYTWLNERTKCVFVKVPKLDYDTDEVTFPQMFDEAEAKRKRDENPREFYAMDMQEPMPIEGCPFDYKNIMTYSFIPREKNGDEPDACYAILDPARTGANYVAMAIFVKVQNLFYLKDVIYEMRPIEELHSTIVEKLIKHNVTQFHIERNTDTSLKTLLEKMAIDRGYGFCKFTEVYTTKNKKDKIAENEAAIKNNLVFPEYTMYGQGSQMRNFMRYFTGYSYLENNKYDDAPDCVAMFAERFLRSASYSTKARCLQL